MKKLEVTAFFLIALAPLPLVEVVGGVKLESFSYIFKWTKRQRERIIHLSISNIDAP